MANFKDFINGALDLFVPHARKEPLNPMAYAKDVNEWFLPWAQMALDEYEGKDQVYDIPGTDVSISPSNTSESVYVTYRTPDGKSSTSRHSTHFSNQEDKDFIDILNDLGMIKSVPRYEKKLWGQNVKKKQG